MKKINVKIDITDEDRNLAEYYAILRNKPMQGSRSIVSKDLDIQYHTSGCIGEIAVRKYLGLDLILPVNTFKNAPDLYWQDNWVEVKSSRTGWFNVKLTEKEDQEAILVSNFEIQKYCLILCSLPMSEFKSIAIQYGRPNYWSGSTKICGYRLRYQDLKYYCALKSQD